MKKGHGAKITAKRESAIVALLERDSVKSAARHIGISESTLFRWLAENDFQTDYRAAKTLKEIAMDTTKPPSVRYMASRTILDLSRLRQSK